MLSRLVLQHAKALPASAQAVQVMSSSSSAFPYPPISPTCRPVRTIHPGKVRLGFIPDEWFTFFYPKTGVTGPYMFGLSLGTYLVSKEWYVLEHEFYSGLTFLMIWVIGVKKFGKQTAEYLDAEVEAVEKEFNKGREDEINSYLENIEAEKKEQWRSEAQLLVVDAKKENVKLQLEAEYRRRLVNVFSEVKKRLDYQVQKNNIERQFAHQHMVEWIVGNVKAALTPDLEKSTLQQCIKDLQGLAPRA